MKMNFNVPVKKAVFKYKIEDNFFVFHYENTEDQNTLSGSFYLGDEDHYYRLSVIDVVEYAIHHLGLPLSVGVVGGTPDTEWHTKMLVTTMDERLVGFKHLFMAEENLYKDFYISLMGALGLVGIKVGVL